MGQAPNVVMSVMVSLLSFSHPHPTSPVEREGLLLQLASVLVPPNGDRVSGDGLKSSSLQVERIDPCLNRLQIVAFSVRLSLAISFKVYRYVLEAQVFELSHYSTSGPFFSQAWKTLVLPPRPDVVEPFAHQYRFCSRDSV